MSALARHCVDHSGDGLEKDQAALARLVGVSRARVTQLMDLSYLAPDIQEEILVAAHAELDGARHRDLLPIAATAGWRAQRRRWHDLRCA